MEAEQRGEVDEVGEGTGADAEAELVFAGAPVAEVGGRATESTGGDGEESVWSRAASIPTDDNPGSEENGRCSLFFKGGVKCGGR